MSRILLADDSPHAQRMGERILREEGFEVASVTDGDTALLRLADVDPDLVIADVFLPGKSGFDICRYVKAHPRHRHARVVLTAGQLEPFNEDEALLAGCDAILKKPFEASVVLAAIQPLIAAAQLDRGTLPPPSPDPVPAPLAAPAIPALPPPDPERVRAAVTLALDAAMPAMIDELTHRVLSAFAQ